MSEADGLPNDGDAAFRDRLRRAMSDRPGVQGDWRGVVRRVRRQQVARRATLVGVPVVAVALVVAGLWAVARRDGGEGRVAATTFVTASPTSSLVAAGTAAPSTTAPASTTVAPSTTIAADPGTSTSTSTAEPVTTAAEPVTAPGPLATNDTVTTTSEAPTTTSVPVPVALGVAADLGLALSGGAVNLVSASDGRAAYVWSVVDGKGVAIDPVTLVSRPIASMPLAAAPQHDGSWVAGGGRVFVRSDTSYATYDIAADTWSAVGALPEARYGLAATVWTGSRVMIWGGSTTNDLLSTPTDALVWEPSTSAWSRTSKAPSARTGFITGAVAGSSVAFAGSATSGFDTAPLLLYRPADDTWREVAFPVELPFWPYLVGHGGRVMVIGISHSASVVWDPATNAFTTFTPSTPANAGQHSTYGVSDGTRLVYYAGGSSLSVLTGAGWRESQPLAMPNAFGMVLVGNRVVIVGSTTGSVATWASAVFSIPIDALGS